MLLLQTDVLTQEELLLSTQGRLLHFELISAAFSVSRKSSDETKVCTAVVGCVPPFSFPSPLAEFESKLSGKHLYNDSYAMILLEKAT